MREAAVGYGMALLATVIWSGNFVVARAVADMIPPWQCNFWRWAVAFVVCLPFAWRHIRRDEPLLRRHWRYVSLMALLGVSLMNTFFYKELSSCIELGMVLHGFTCRLREQAIVIDKQIDQSRSHHNKYRDPFSPSKFSCFPFYV